MYECEYVCIYVFMYVSMYGYKHLCMYVGMSVLRLCLCI